MKTQEDRIAKMKEQAEKVLKQSPSSRVKEDVEEFEKTWKIVSKKIGKDYLKVYEKKKIYKGAYMSLRGWGWGWGCIITLIS